MNPFLMTITKTEHDKLMVSFNARCILKRKRIVKRRMDTKEIEKVALAQVEDLLSSAREIKSNRRRLTSTSF